MQRPQLQTWVTSLDERTGHESHQRFSEVVAGTPPSGLHVVNMLEMRCFRQFWSAFVVGSSFHL